MFFKKRKSKKELLEDKKQQDLRDLEILKEHKRLEEERQKKELAKTAERVEEIKLEREQAKATKANIEKVKKLKQESNLAIERKNIKDQLLADIDDNASLYFEKLEEFNFKIKDFDDDREGFVYEILFEGLKPIYVNYSDIDDRFTYYNRKLDSVGTVVRLVENINTEYFINDLGITDFQWLDCLCEGLKKYILNSIELAKADMGIHNLRSGVDEIGIFEKVREDYKGLEWVTRDTGNAVIASQQEAFDSEGWERDQLEYNQEVAAHDIMLKETTEEFLTRLKDLHLSYNVLLERQGMFKKLLLRYRSKSKNLKTRVSVTGPLYNLKDTQGNYLKFKFISRKGFNKRRLVKRKDSYSGLAEKTFVQEFNDSFSNVGSIVVTSVFGMPQVSHIEKIKNELANYYGFDNISIDVDSNSKSLVLIDSVSSLPALVAVGKDYFEENAHVLGYDKNTTRFSVPFGSLGHCLIAGKSGSGKSVFQNTLLGSLYKNIDKVDHIYLCDFKGGVEFFPYNSVLGGKQTIISDVQAFSVLAEKLVKVMEKRLATMADPENPQREWSGNYVYVMLDEYAVIENQKSMMPKEIYDSIKSNVNKLMMQARATRIYLIFGVQKATDKELPSSVKNNVHSRFIFNVEEKLTATNVMGSGWVDAGISADTFKKGVFAFKGDNGYKVLKSGYIEDNNLHDYLGYCSFCVEAFE